MTKEFRMHRGVRQGDPLSPFLFIIAVEALHVAILEAHQKSLFNGISVGQNNVCISHLQFADDAIFVGEWPTREAKNLIRILRCFYLASGFKVNLGKSRLYGVSVRREEVDNLASSLNCSSDSLPFTYLGLPVGANMNRITSWNPIIDKFKKRLSLWKSKTLSFGGRLTLIKAVMDGLSNYYFSLFRAPKTVLKTLESIRNRFFWGDVSVNRKIH